jgi:uroporphyrinogen-III synthase
MTRNQHNLLPPVVVTRPAGQAAVLADRLSGMRQVVLFPLLEIAQLPDAIELKNTLANLMQYAMVVFVSPNAVHAVFAHIDHWPAGVAVGVVGEGSRLALVAHGVTADNTTIYTPPDIQKSDSEGLLESLPLDTLRGQQVLIVRGQHGRDFLTQTLHKHAIAVHHVTAYLRRVPVMTPARQLQLDDFLHGRFDFVLTSSEALRHLVEMTRQYAGEEGVVKMQHQRIIVTHNRISDIARSLGFSNVILCGTGDEQIIATLQSLS